MPRNRGQELPGVQAITLRISDELDLPLEAVTQPIAIIARRGAGKSYCAAVMTEEMIKAGVPVVVIDPMGAFWGLRASADGKKEGLPVTILGGEHGDVPLEPTAGKAIAHFVVEHPGPYVLDLSLFESNAAQYRFAADFGETIYRAKSKAKAPLHLVVDEADSFAPQKPQPGQQRMLGAYEAIVRRGRIRGLGVTMITQRPAVLNKNVLTQAEILITLQMTGPQDRKAIDAWVQGHGTLEERDELLASLASLQKGQAWIWSPSLLNVFKLVQIRRRETFDSSKTPEMGDRRTEPQRFAPVDLAALQKEMTATIEKAKADDPKELRKQIAQLQGELKRQPTATKEVRVEVPVEIPVLSEEAWEFLQGLQADLLEFNDSMKSLVKTVSTFVPREQPVKVGDYDPLPTGPALLDYWRAELGEGVPRQVFELLITSWPQAVSNAEIAEALGIDPGLSTLRNALSRLRSMGVVVGNAVNDDLMEAVGG